MHFSVEGINYEKLIKIDKNYKLLLPIEKEWISAQTSKEGISVMSPNNISNLRNCIYVIITIVRQKRLISKW